jgi:peptidoglycan/xylan/chitin deacetylase (PgdA/CDA1 family)
MKSLLPRALELLIGPAAGPVRSKDELPDLAGPGSPPVFSLSPSPKLMTDLKQEGYEHLRHFAALPSNSSPRWLLPIGTSCGMLAATQMYFPHKRAARLLKRLFMGLIGSGWDGWLSSQVLIGSQKPLPLENLVRDITGEERPIFALSIGRQPAIRKLTVQVMNPQGEVLGYMKLPLTEAAIDRVRNEAATLERLWKFPTLRTHIPQLLHAGTWNDSYLLFESALPGKLGPASLTEMHTNLLRTLWSVNRIERSGQNLVDEIGPKWNKAVVLLGSKWRELGQEVLRRSALDMDRLTIPCGVSHGDFAPWNTRVHQGQLLLFDWESTKWVAPNSWDIFHFRLQAAVSLKKGIGNSFPTENTGRTSYLLYLLYSVIQFLQEDNWTAIGHRRKLLVSELGQTLHIRSERLPKTEAITSIDRPAGIGARPLVSQASPAPRIVTTSWDDGDPRDLRIAELLRSRGLPGTFYIPMSGYLNKPTLVASDLRSLSSEGFEIGGHSVSHSSLTLSRGEQLGREVRICKQTLEQLVGTEVSMFCYPNGRYNSRVIQEVRCAGYKGARTTCMLSTATDFHPFEMPTTLQAFPHPRTGYLRDLGRAKNIPGLWKFTTELSRLESWIDIGKRLFSQVLEHGGIWHLYGHSWEIDDLALWGELREILDHVSHRSNVIYLTNSQLLSFVNRADGVSSLNASLEQYSGGPRDKEKQIPCPR